MCFLYPCNDVCTFVGAATSSQGYGLVLVSQDLHLQVGAKVPAGWIMVIPDLGKAQWHGLCADLLPGISVGNDCRGPQQPRLCLQQWPELWGSLVMKVAGDHLIILLPQ